jgi:hypothetical protein
MARRRKPESNELPLRRRFPLSWETGGYQIFCYLKNLGSPQLSLNANHSDPRTICAFPSLVFLVCVLLEVGHL